MELHNKVVNLSSQSRSKGIYGYVTVQTLLVCVFEVVLAIFQKGQ